MHRVPKALPHRCASSRSIFMGNNTYLLAYGVVEGPMVRRGHISSGRKDGEGKVTRNNKERDCETCIQHQFHRGGTVPVNAWGQLDMATRVHCYLSRVLAREEPLPRRIIYRKSSYTSSQFLKLSPSSPTNCAQQWSPCLWRMAIQLTATSLHVTAAPSTVQSTVLY